MTNLEASILQALLELDAAAALLRQGGPKPDLSAILQRLRTLGAELPPTSDPDLRHYMQRQSYEKARLFLQGRAAENARGTCGH